MIPATDQKHAIERYILIIRYSDTTRSKVFHTKTLDTDTDTVYTVPITAIMQL